MKHSEGPVDVQKLVARCAARIPQLRVTTAAKACGVTMKANAKSTK